MDKQESNQRYYQNNREKLIQKSIDRQREYYGDETMRQKILERNANYYRLNREKILQRRKERTKI